MDSTLTIVRPDDNQKRTDRGRQEFLALFDAHGAVLSSTLRRLCGNNHDAEDLLQETAVRVWRGLDRRPWLRNPRAWLITIAYRTFLDARRRDRLDVVEQSSDPLDHRIEPADSRLARTEDLNLVNEQIDRLPPDVRLVVALHYMGGLSIRQTAAAMETSVAITKNRLHAALKQLRSALE